MNEKDLKEIKEAIHLATKKSDLDIYLGRTMKLAMTITTGILLNMAIGINSDIATINERSKTHVSTTQLARMDFLSVSKYIIFEKKRSVDVVDFTLKMTTSPVRKEDVDKIRADGIIALNKSIGDYGL